MIYSLNIIHYIHFTIHLTSLLSNNLQTDLECKTMFRNTRSLSVGIWSTSMKIALTLSSTEWWNSKPKSNVMILFTTKLTQIPTIKRIELIIITNELKSLHIGAYCNSKVRKNRKYTLKYFLLNFFMASTSSHFSNLYKSLSKLQHT